MPAGWVKDERLWEKAKGLARSQYPKVSPASDRFYAITTGIYKKAGGRINPAESLLSKFFVACAWCKTVKTKRGQHPVPIPYKLFTSHGICQACAKKERDRALKHTGVKLNAPADAFTAFHGFQPDKAVRIHVKSTRLGRQQWILGRVAYISYFSNKFDKRRRLYHHDFQTPPLLLMDSKTGLMHIAPENWKVTGKGIEG